MSKTPKTFRSNANQILERSDKHDRFLAEVELLVSDYRSAVTEASALSRWVGVPDDVRREALNQADSAKLALNLRIRQLYGEEF